MLPRLHLHRVKNLFYKVVYLEPGKINRYFARLKFRDLVKVGDQVAKAVDILWGFGQKIRCQLFVFKTIILERLYITLDGKQRGFKFMRYIG